MAISSAGANSTQKGIEALQTNVTQSDLAPVPCATTSDQKSLRVCGGAAYFSSHWVNFCLFMAPLPDVDTPGRESVFLAGDSSIRDSFIQASHDHHSRIHASPGDLSRKHRRLILSTTTKTIPSSQMEWASASRQAAVVPQEWASRQAENQPLTLVGKRWAS